MKADIVLTNGKIYCVDPQHSMVEAMAVKDEKIIFVGSDIAAHQYVDSATTVIDLHGKLVMPAFIDGHCHYSISVETVCGVDLKDVNQPADYLDALKTFHVANPATKQIRGKGFLEAVYPGKGPKKEDLDDISNDIPIIIYSESFHSLWCNSFALNLAGITAETPDPENGRIERNEDGSPSGTLREKAMNMVFDKLPDWEIEQYEKGILYYQDLALKLGYSTAYDPWLDMRGRNAIEAAKRLDEKGLLKMTFKAAYFASPDEDIEQVTRLVAQREKDNRGDKFHIEAVKFFTDGTIEAGTAGLLFPYKGHLAVDKKENDTGDKNWETSRLQRVMAEVDKAGFQIHMHAIGDGAVRQCLDAFEHVLTVNGRRDSRHCIAHSTLCSAEDLLRYQSLNVGVMLNVYWAENDENMHVMKGWLGDNYPTTLYQIQSYFDSGALVTNSSDYPVTGEPLPFAGIETGLTRLAPENYHPWVRNYDDPKFKTVPNPEECSNLQDLIESFTISQAKQNFMENITGSLEIGKKADFIIVDKNIFDIAMTDIGKAEVQSTYINGLEVFHR